MQKVSSPLILTISASQIEGDPINGQVLLYKGVANNGQTLKYNESTGSWDAADSTFGGTLTAYLPLSGGVLTDTLSGTTATFNQISANFFFGDGSRLRNVGTPNALPLSGGVLTDTLSGTTAAFDAISANFFFGDGSRLRNVGTPNALPLSGGTITDFLAISSTFSVKNMLLGQELEGPFFGRTKIKESNLSLVESTISRNWKIIPNTGGGNWTKIATSADGRITAATKSGSNIYISKDYGNTWSPKASVKSWSGVALSLDGKTMLATSSGGSGQVYISTNYGEDWSEIIELANKDWRAAAISSTGKVQAIVAANDQIYKSFNYGANWSPVDSSRDWRDIAMSSDGRIQTAVVHNGQIYTSTDFGNIWTGTGSTRQYDSISMSSDGRIQVATSSGDNTIDANQSFGATGEWISTGEGQGPLWRASAISSDGKIVATAGASGYIYTSFNYANYNGWINTLDKGGVAAFVSITMSSDGKLQFAVDANGDIYVSNATGVYTGNLSITESLSAPSLSGTFFGDGSKLTGISAPVTSVANKTGAVTLVSADISNFEAAAQGAAKLLIGQGNGLAGLDSTGKIPASYIPASVDEIVEYDTVADFPNPGSKTKIYFTLSDVKTYRWSGTAYVEIVASPGTTDALPEGSLPSRRYYTSDRENLLLKKAGGTMTGELVGTSAKFNTGVFITSLSTTVLSATTLFGDGSNLTGIKGTDTEKLPLSGGVLTGTGSLSVVSLSGQTGIFTNSLSTSIVRGRTGIFTTSLSTAILSATVLYGDGSNLTGVKASGGTSTDTTKFPLSGGALTGEGQLSAVSLSAQTGIFYQFLSAASISATNIRGTAFFGNGSGLTNIPISVAGRTGAVTITTADLNDFTSSTTTVVRTLTGIANGIVPLDSFAKIPLQYIAGSIAQLITATNFDGLTALTTAQQGRDKENLYLTNNNGKIYRYSGVPPLSYVEIVSAPGSTDSIVEGPIATTNRQNRYYTGAREDELLKKTGGTITGNIVLSSTANIILSSSGITVLNLSATNLRATNLSATNLFAQHATFFASVSAPSLSGVFFGDGSRLTGIGGADTSKLPLTGGSLTGTGSLSVVSLSGQRGIFYVSLSTASLTANNLTLRNNVFVTTGNLVAQVGTFNVSVSAPMLSGVHYGDGSRLTGLVSIDTSKLPLTGGVLTGPGSLSAVSLSAQTGIFYTSLSTASLTANNLRSNTINVGTLTVGTFIGSVNTTVVEKTTNFVLALSDAGDFIKVSQGAIISVPPYASVPFSTGTQIIFGQSTTSTVSFSAGNGVTLISYSDRTSIAGRGSIASLINTGSNEWFLAGDLV